MKRKIFSCILVLAIFLCLAACGGGESALSPGTEDSASPGAAEPITLKLATYGHTHLPFVSDFNESQTDYYVELVDYSQDHTVTWSEALIRINAELASGEGPDMFYLWDLKMDPAVYGARGYLEDLYPYIDAEPDYDREDFVQSLFSAYEVDGALYCTLPGFDVMTMMGRASDVGDGGDWTFERLLELAEEYGGAGLFAGGVSKTAFLVDCIGLVIGDLVDYDAGTADFDSDYFKSILAFCNTLGDKYDPTDTKPVLRLFAVGTFMEIQYFEEEFGGELSIVGFPAQNGGASYFIGVLDQFGINANSAHKDGAWACLRAQLSVDYQKRSTGLMFPSNLDCMEWLVEYSMTTRYDEDTGREITQRGFFDDRYAYHAATEEQVEKTLALIDATVGVSRSDLTVSAIVREEAAYYFAGEKSLDETIANIQTRVSLYLAEQG